MNNFATHIRALLKKKWPLLTLFALMLLIPDTVFAGTTNSPAEEAEQIMAQIAQTVMKVLNMLIWPLLLIIGDLMDSDWIVGPGMEERLLSIWVQVRNLVNIVFVLVMLVMALYNVTGMGKDGNLAIKTGLPKLIIGIVLVNFTYLGGKLVLDLSSIATTAVFALPEAIDTGSESFSFENEKTDLKNNICYKNYTSTEAAKDGIDPRYYYIAKKDAPAITKIFCGVDTEKYTGELSDEMSGFFARLNANNIGLIMAVNMGALNSLSYVNDNVQEFGELLINQLFSIIMFIAFAVSYLVLGLVLLARIAVLWVAMALSPLLVLFYVIPELKSYAGEAGGFSDKVMKHLMSPIMIGISMTIGFMMIDAMSDVAGFAESEVSNIALKDIANSELLITGLADLQKFMIALISIVVLWTGVFAATNDTYVSGITGKIRSFTENAGQTILGAAKFIPGIPVRVGEEGERQMLSPNQIMSFGPSILRAYQAKEDSQAQKVLESMPALEGLFGNVHQGLRELAENLEKLTNNKQIAQGLLKEHSALDANTSPADLRSYRHVLEKMIGNSKLDDKVKEDLSEKVKKANGTELFKIIDQHHTEFGFKDKPEVENLRTSAGTAEAEAESDDKKTTTTTNPPTPTPTPTPTPPTRRVLDAAALGTAITATTLPGGITITAPQATQIATAIAPTISSNPRIDKAALVTQITTQAAAQPNPISLGTDSAAQLANAEAIADAIIAAQQTPAPTP